MLDLTRLAFGIDVTLRRLVRFKLDLLFWKPPLLPRMWMRAQSERKCAPSFWRDRTERTWAFSAPPNPPHPLLHISLRTWCLGMIQVSPCSSLQGLHCAATGVRIQPVWTEICTISDALGNKRMGRGGFSRGKNRIGLLVRAVRTVRSTYGREDATRQVREERMGPKAQGVSKKTR